MEVWKSGLSWQWSAVPVFCFLQCAGAISLKWLGSNGNRQPIRYPTSRSMFLWDMFWKSTLHDMLFKQNQIKKIHSHVVFHNNKTPGNHCMKDKQAGNYCCPGSATASTRNFISHITLNAHFSFICIVCSCICESCYCVAESLKYRKQKVLWLIRQQQPPAVDIWEEHSTINTET